MDGSLLFTLDRLDFVKLGGLGQSYTALRFDGDAEPSSSEKVAARFRPYVETCITAFGASRCMFESNFPVDKISYSYPVFWNACKLMAKGAGSSEKAALQTKLDAASVLPAPL